MASSVVAAISLALLLSVSSAAPSSFASSSSSAIYAHGRGTYLNHVVAIHYGKYKTTILVSFQKNLTGTVKGTMNGIQVIYIFPNGHGKSNYQAIFNGVVGTINFIVGKTLSATQRYSEGTSGLVGLSGSLQISASGNFSVFSYSGTMSL
jgi:hypothetical protein